MLQASMISVSQLCCPLCWDLFDILNSSLPLCYRGCHSTVYPVELPTWLSSLHVDQVTAKLQSCLQAELETFLSEGVDEVHDTDISHDSISALSAASSTRDENVPLELGDAQNDSEN